VNRHADAARAAALLDDLFRSAQAAPVAQAVRGVAPTGWLDQLDAAADQLADGVRHAGQTLAGVADIGYRPYATYPAWVTLGVQQALAEWAAGTAATCQHQPVIAAPRPVHAAAWKPGLVVCGACTHLLALARTDPRDSRCDGCGHQCTGPDHGDGIWAHVIVAGALTYSVGVCGPCRWTEPEETSR
jgi:hypothetical protein